MKRRIVGIMGAMEEEVSGVIALLDHPEVREIGMRKYYIAKLNSVDVVVVFSRWGKVAAATTVSTLITEFNITELLFTGVAGAIHPDVRIGDVVVSRAVMQHDMDARPLMPQYVIPLHNKTFFEAPADKIEEYGKVIDSFLKEGDFDHELFAQFNIVKPRMWGGDIASGDQFFSSNAQKKRLFDAFPTVLCVEMEGAAVAQICEEFGIPWIVIRTISDSADDNSPVDFQLFIEKVAAFYAAEMIKKIIKP
ncbi:5'-methylthioadenosine/adenosylhomocysteine nucleosidase [Bacteroidales bacterium OttesenSCG-928-B11]|nr:5'-methylthioadenosine/adenosylhomocysteine nucleosidase [Bacteroidales bacterium OttesenSCG-928-E04]MDL2309113.1 5'-methylthioadenosine/adenosylhomocysteine nucleosidase [Bacteroidales bacterium OttesenSCG-928-C03]MDL2312946.1 5'-methylthioadenosine/adenosylhomocysteine nucleosidase [Bacteroidales bacterium OttesenSCG-928-B11]MDL2326676.1 5'-methylthioadenosine/adenosylhomocysteine nucleosidase [Bacteroidales bacterium OttesenSCG-928-A14]